MKQLVTTYKEDKKKEEYLNHQRTERDDMTGAIIYIKLIGDYENVWWVEI